MNPQISRVGTMNNGYKPSIAESPGNIYSPSPPVSSGSRVKIRVKSKKKAADITRKIVYTFLEFRVEFSDSTIICFYSLKTLKNGLEMENKEN